MTKKLKVSLRGKNLLRDPLLNKGTAFTKEERKALHLDGILPDHISTIEEQLKRRYFNFTQKKSDIEKYAMLTDLQNRNETLFYRLVLDHIHEMLPFVYTPTIGEASIQYSLYYNQSRGIFIPHDKQDEIETLLSNGKRDDVRVIVVTDGSRVLGLGDVGVGGMAIPIGKLTLYTLFGGVDPSKTLPIFLDVGTNNESLLKDPLYLGKHEKRISGSEYKTFVDKFVAAVKKVYPNALLQWEDFSKENASSLLKRHQNEICSFNDDIQGTAASVLAGLLSALKIREKSLHEERIAIFGGGSAGMGVAEILVDYMIHKGVSEKVAKRHIYIIDRDGLIHDALEHLSPDHARFAHNYSEIAFWSKGDQKITLSDVVENGGITILIGVSAQAGAFNKHIVTTLCKNTHKPIIFPLSNPNTMSEAKPEDLLEWSHGEAIMATGSPFPPVLYKGKTHVIDQCNNVYIFPAFGLATTAVKFSKITNGMFFVAAEELSKHSLPHLFPPFSHLRDVTKMMAKEIILFAIKEGLAEKIPLDQIDDRLNETMWYPSYHTYIA